MSELVKKIWLAQKKKHQAKERHILQKEALHFTVVGIAAHLAPGDDDVHNKQKEREEHELQ